MRIDLYSLIRHEKRITHWFIQQTFSGYLPCAHAFLWEGMELWSRPWGLLSWSIHSKEGQTLSTQRRESRKMWGGGASEHGDGLAMGVMTWSRLFGRQTFQQRDTNTSFQAFVGVTLTILTMLEQREDM